MGGGEARAARSSCWLRGVMRPLLPGGGGRTNLTTAMPFSDATHTPPPPPSPPQQVQPGSIFAYRPEARGPAGRCVVGHGVLRWPELPQPLAHTAPGRKVGRRGGNRHREVDPRPQGKRAQGGRPQASGEEGTVRSSPRPQGKRAQ